VQVHELSMCDAIARTVVDRAAGRRVLSVSVRIGHLRQVVPDTMTFCWEMVTAGTELAGTGLDIEHVVATVSCDDCEAVTTLDAPVLACASCGSRAVTLRSGEELMILSLDAVGEPVATEVMP
jgi:hydrogenase nickel incorporation protein HypA/HybF